MDLTRTSQITEEIKSFLLDYNNLDNLDQEMIIKLLYSYFIDKSTSKETKREVIKNMMIPCYISRNILEKEILISFYKYIDQNDESIPLFRWLCLTSKYYELNLTSVYELLERFTFGMSLYSNLKLFYQWHSKRIDILRIKIDNL